MTPGFPREFQPTVLKTLPDASAYTYGTVTLFGTPFQGTSVWPRHRNGRLTTPHLPCGIRFELRRLRSPLLTTSRLISSPAPTKMFQFGAFPIHRIDTKCQDVLLGYLRITGSLRLPAAYRSLARPSSALEPSHPLIG